MAQYFVPQQGLVAGESQRLADADLDEHDRDTGEDHFAHVKGKTCKTCGRPIEGGQAARRRGEADWVHDVCPIIKD